MCDAIALARSNLPTELIGRHELDRRLHERDGGQTEIHFYYRDPTPQLPIWLGGQLQIVRWGNGQGQSRFLPRSGWTWQASIDDGTWRNVETTQVDIPARLGFDRGVWYVIRQGIRGLLVPDERGNLVVYMICEPASHYYRIMTRNDRMPVFIQDRV